MLLPLQLTLSCQKHAVNKYAGLESYCFHQGLRDSKKGHVKNVLLFKVKGGSAKIDDVK